MEDLTNEQQLAMLYEAGKEVKAILPLLENIKDISITIIEEEHVDPMLNIGNLFQICAYMESNPKSILNDSAPRFLIGHAEQYPGGFCYPPSEDFVEDETDIVSAKDAVVKALRMYVLYWFEQALLAYEEEKMCDEEMPF